MADGDPGMPDDLNNGCPAQRAVGPKKEANGSMKIKKDALVLIADGEKALFLRNIGDAVYPNLQVEKKKTQDNPPTREQAANRRGRMYDGTGRQDGNTHKSAFDDTDWHELAKERFASELADLLYKRAHAGDFDDLILVATPNILGELRSHMHSEVTDRIVTEIDKNLTNHPIAEIEQLLQSHEPA